MQKETAGKKSKGGRLTVEMEEGEYKTYQSGQGRIGTAQDLLGEEVFRDGQSCRTECFSEIRDRIAAAHIRELKKTVAATTSGDAKRLKTDAAPAPTETDADGAADGAAAADGADCVYVVIPGSKNSAKEAEEAVDGTAITGEA